MKMHQKLLTTCIVFSLFSLAHSDVTLTKHLYDLDADPLLRCNDGSPGGYYYREAVSEEHSDKWIFYLEGGGWCWDEVSCVQRLLLNGIFVWGSDLVSSNHWDEVKTFSEGLFTMEGSGWEQGHLVYVPYCSSDAHMGDMEINTGLNLIQYRGRRLARAAVSQLVGNMRENQKIIFGGTSAGGRGSMVLVDHLHDLLHPSSRVYGLHDSGAYQDIPPYDPGYTPFGDQCLHAYSRYQPPISATCALSYPDLWQCVCGEYMLPRLETPSQVVIYTYDSYQLSNDLGTSPAHWTFEMCRYVEDQFVPGMMRTLEEVWQTGQHSVFGAGCYKHGMLMSSAWSQVKVDNVSAQDQLLSWISDDIRSRVVSSCHGVNCQDSCPHLDTSDEALCYW